MAVKELDFHTMSEEGLRAVLYSMESTVKKATALEELISRRYQSGYRDGYRSCAEDHKLDLNFKKEGAQS